MKISKLTEATGAWGLRAQPEDYDAQPALPTLLLDRQPRTLSPDRVALAAYLAFDRYCSGRFEAPQWVSPALAEAISVDAAPTWIHAVPVELYAKGLPVGVRRMHLRLEGVPGYDVDADDPADTLRVMRSDHSRGARMTFAGLEVSSNAWLHATTPEVDRRLSIATACALLYAEDLELDGVIIPTGAATPEELDRVRALVSTVRFDVDEA